MITISIRTRLSMTVVLTVLVCMMFLTVPVFPDNGDNDYCIDEFGGIFEYALHSEVASYQSREEMFESPAVIRSRYVKVQFEKVAREFEENHRAGRLLHLNLFEDVAVNARMERVIHNKSGSTTWIGKVAGNDSSSVVFTVLDNVMVGSFTIGNKFYSIRYLGGACHEIQEVDPSKAPESMEPKKIGNLNIIDTHEQEQGRVGMLTGNTRIDVMVVYTSEARIEAGGTSAIKATIDQGVAEANIGYINSLIHIELNLVYTQEVSYSESLLSWDNVGGQLEATDDGVMDEVHPLRDFYGADIVALIVERLDSNLIAGRANAIMATAATAFCVVQRNAIFQHTHSFAHEVGHLQGARHDRSVDDTDYSPYTYNHGYVNYVKKWRTIMTWPDSGGCWQYFDGCTVINHFSNPDVLYGGVPTGIDGGAGVGADNALCLNNTAATIAGFRPTVPEDLYVINCTASLNVVFLEDTVNMSCTVGGISRSSSYLTYYLSRDSVLDAGDEELTHESIGVLDEEETYHSTSFSFQYPNLLSEGTWYIIFKADNNNSISETNEGNNTCFASFTVGNPLKADLIVQSATVKGKKVVFPVDVVRGGLADISCIIKNQGTEVAGSSTLKIYYSTDSTLNTGDLLIDSIPVESLAVGAASSQKITQFLVPLNAPSSFYILFVADANGQVTESNETNNLFAFLTYADSPFVFN